MIAVATRMLKNHALNVEARQGLNNPETNLNIVKIAVGLRRILEDKMTTEQKTNEERSE